MASFGVIFDADGVLFDSERQSLEALRLAVEEITNGSIELNSQGLEYLCGRDDDSIVELMNKEHGLTIDPAHFRRLKLDCYRRAIAADPIAPMPGAVALIDQIDAESIPYAIATAAIRAKLELTLTTLGLRDRFAVITSVDEVAAGKPDPGVFLLAGERLGFRRPDLLYSKTRSTASMRQTVPGCSWSESRGLSRASSLSTLNAWSKGSYK